MSMKKSEQENCLERRQSLTKLINDDRAHFIEPILFDEVVDDSVSFLDRTDSDLRP